MYKKSKDYISVRGNHVAHHSKKVDLSELKRMQWLPIEELIKAEYFVAEIFKFLNSYGKKNYNEEYATAYPDVLTSVELTLQELTQSTG